MSKINLENIEFMIYPNILKEIEDVARKISKKISEGYRYSDFAIYTTVPDEYYKDIDKDKPDEALADAFVIKPAREEKSGEHTIEGEGIIQPKKSYVYGAGLAGGAWSIKEKRPITLVPLADQRVKLVWNDVVSGNFTLVYTVEGATYEKMIVVESLF